MDPLADFTRLVGTPDPWPVFRRGEGPPVIVIHELFGLTPPAIAFGRRLADAGFTAYLPVLAGPAPSTRGRDKARAAVSICVSREIHVLRTGATSPVVGKLRDLAERAVEEAGTDGAGVVGMCFSGGFALALASADPVRAGVAAQPSLPFATPVTPWCKRDLGLDADHADALSARLEGGLTEVYYTRFSEDRASPRERREAAQELLGTKGLTVDELPSYPDNEFGFAPKDHSVLSIAPGRYPAGSAAALRLERTFDDVIAFLRLRLVPPAS